MDEILTAAVDEHLADALHEAGAGGFVHAGTASDPDLRYLTGVDAADRRLAFVYVAAEHADSDSDSAEHADSDSAERTNGEATVVVPPSLAASVETNAPSWATVVPVEPPTDPASAAASLLTDRLTADDTVLAPRHVPHDAALYVQREGFDLSSSPAIAEARVEKADAELARIEAAAEAAGEGMARARSVLAAAKAVDGDLHWRDYPLTPDRLRREVNAALAEAGVDAAGNTRITVGSDIADTGTSSTVDAERTDALPASETVIVSVTPRGPAGYHATLTRTFVVAGEGGWERRAHVACEAARRVGVDEVEAGVPGVGVVEELVAELGSFGFSPAGRAASGAARNVASGIGHGLGLAAHEAPLLRGGDDLAAGTVLALGPAVEDAEGGRVVLSDTVVVEEGGATVLTDVPTSIVPGAE